MKKLSLTSSLAVAAMLLMFASPATAVVIPAGLNPGDTYHLVFVTDDVHDATSSDIADYNAFVQTEAALNPGVTGTDIGVQYRAIATTATTNAIDNAPISGPVYLTDGISLVALDSSDMWDGSILTPISVNQWGQQIGSGLVWTGTGTDGFAPVPNPDPLYLGVPGDVEAMAGNYGSATGTWIEDSPEVTSGEEEGNLFPFYALSTPLVVPSAVPEPSTYVMAAMGLLGLAFLSCRRNGGLRRRRA